MGTLVLRFRGANAYVPHVDDSSLMVVMPNATRLGKSRVGARDFTVLPRHLPTLWEEPFPASPRRLTLTSPVAFPGARLTFGLDGSPTPHPPDLSSIRHITENGWLDVASSALTANPDGRVAGQVLVTAGKVAEHIPAMVNCNKQWPDANFPLSLAPVVAGLDVTIGGVTGIVVTATRWVDNGSTKELFNRQNIGANDTVSLFIGNFCAEDALRWPRNSTDGRVRDDDFKWVFEVSQSGYIRSLLEQGDPLPAPVVAGSGIDVSNSIAAAMLAAWGGGGGLGCECNGCGDRPKNF